MPSNTPKVKPRVFISYAQEEGLNDEVEKLAKWLAENGVEVISDHQYKDRPPDKGWYVWMQHSIEDADCVLMVCTEHYKNYFEKRELPQGKGYGATFEGAIITKKLYEDHCQNDKFYPILPDDGRIEHVPDIFVPWYNNHHFPSGNDRILELLRAPSKTSRKTEPKQPQLPGKISGSNDPRLQPREGFVIGREAEIAKVMEFLNGTEQSAALCSHITGSGGIGKTEVCKAALKRWLESNPKTSVFWIQVSDNADSRYLFEAIGKAVGLSPETIAKILDVEQLRAYLPSGIYYLDNLEVVAETNEGRRLLKNLAQLPSIRLLASSRVPLDGVLGRAFPIYHLDTDSAVKLFEKCWTGSSQPDHIELRDFCAKELGCHALSITLISRLGRAYSWQRLQQVWKEEGTALATFRNATERIESLEISFAITVKLLAKEAGALNLWQFAALFPSDGFDEETLNLWEQISKYPRARLALAEHHILTFSRDNEITMLPPFARYALEAITTNATAKDAFVWNDTRKLAYEYFIELSRNASDIASDEKVTQTRAKCTQQLWAILQLLDIDRKAGTLEHILVNKLHLQLRNVYQFNILAGISILRFINDLLDDSLSKKLLGDLERRLGNIEAARQHYDNAIELYKKEQDQLGLANVYQSLGDMLLANKKNEEAQRYYRDALSLYRSEMEPMGTAYTLAKLIRCHHRLCRNSQDDLIALVREALSQAAASGIDSVKHYVWGALYEICDKDVGKLAAFLEKIGEEIGNKDKKYK